MNTETAFLWMAGIAVMVFLSALALTARSVMYIMRKKNHSKLMALPSGSGNRGWIKTAVNGNLCSLAAADKGKSL